MPGQHQHRQQRPALRQPAQQGQPITGIAGQQCIDQQQVDAARVALQQVQQRAFVGNAAADLHAAVLAQHHFHAQSQYRMRGQQCQAARLVREQSGNDKRHCGRSGCTESPP
ncbi:hypothetical protein D3C81_1761040 [compost metagenome]